jgi:hypothetical protein
MSPYNVKHITKKTSSTDDASVNKDSYHLSGIHPAGIGTFPYGRLPQCHKASPSTALDEYIIMVISLYCCVIFVKGKYET